MHDLDIRLAMLKPQSRQRFKDLAINSGDDDLMMCITLGHNTSGKIAAATGITVQSASLRLAKLRSKGYVTRKQMPQDSGGYEYVYSNIFKCEKEDE